MEETFTYDTLGRMTSRQAVTAEHVGGLTRTKQYWGACEYVTESDGNVEQQLSYDASEN